MRPGFLSFLSFGTGVLSDKYEPTLLVPLGVLCNVGSYVLYAALLSPMVAGGADFGRVFGLFFGPLFLQALGASLTWTTLGKIITNRVPQHRLANLKGVHDLVGIVSAAMGIALAMAMMESSGGAGSYLHVGAYLRVLNACSALSVGALPFALWLAWTQRSGYGNPWKAGLGLEGAAEGAAPSARSMASMDSQAEA